MANNVEKNIHIVVTTRDETYDGDDHWFSSFSPSARRLSLAQVLPRNGDHPNMLECEVERRSLHGRSEEHTSELQSLMRISYAVFCLKKKTQHNIPVPLN